MRCHIDEDDFGSALREARKRQGLSQRQLALRASTSQDAISRIERGVEAPTLARFSQLMLAMGLRPAFRLEPLDAPVPSSELAVAKQLTAPERLREAIGWNHVASRLAAAGDRARSEGHPATRKAAG